MKSKFSFLIRNLFTFLFLMFLVIVVMLSMRPEIIAPNRLVPSSALLGYPAGPTATKTQIGYPAPNGKGSLITPIATQSISMGIKTPMFDDKSNLSVSSEQRGIYATAMAQKIKLAESPSIGSTATPYVFSFRSPSELPQIILTDPFFGNLRNDSICLKSGIVGSPIFIHSLNDFGDYYLLPYYKNNKVCGKAIVKINGNIGRVAGWSDSVSTIFPDIDATNASNKVTQKTGKTVIGTPILAHQTFQELPLDPFNPIWKATTSDAKVYYVSFVTGIMEDGTIQTVVNVFDAESLHSLKK